MHPPVDELGAADPEPCSGPHSGSFEYLARNRKWNPPPSEQSSDRASRRHDRRLEAQAARSQPAQPVAQLPSHQGLHRHHRGRAARRGPPEALDPGRGDAFPSSRGARGRRSLPRSRSLAGRHSCSGERAPRARMGRNRGHRGSLVRPGRLPGGCRPALGRMASDNVRFTGSWTSTRTSRSTTRRCHGGTGLALRS